jgi:hypothetical protein
MPGAAQHRGAVPGKTIDARSAWDAMLRGVT